MILIDANILIYAYDTDSPFHEDARRWFSEAMDRRDEIGFAWITLLAFLRIADGGFTRGRLPEAIEVIEELLSQSNVQIVTPTAGHWPVLKRLLAKSQASGNLIPDAYLAALALEHNATLCTNDRDFTRFHGLKLMNPVETQ